LDTQQNLQVISMSGYDQSMHIEKHGSEKHGTHYIQHDLGGKTQLHSAALRGEKPALKDDQAGLFRNAGKHIQTQTQTQTIRKLL
jgi:hypothetical protein|tara:strand:- start:4422 stop:4676 length:255 start_codon:yes stop_codon:yes gene_type:complete